MNDVAVSTTIVNDLFYFITAISIILFVAIVGIMLFFIWRYHRKRNPKATPIHGSLKLEIIWTIAPIILVLVMFFVSYEGYEKMMDVPDDAMEVKITGRMWSWLFEYENGLKTDTLYVPANTPVAIHITSQDVNHSFYVPAFRIKADAIKGHVNTLWFEVNKIGQYDVACAEYCGLNHAYMYSKVVAMSDSSFQAWYSSSGKIEVKDLTPAEKILVEGQQLMQEKGCFACHTTDGSKLIGPTFKGMYSKLEKVSRDGEIYEVTVDEAYIERSLFEPNSEILVGYQPLMPPQTGIVSPDEVEKIVSYIKALK